MRHGMACVRSLSAEELCASPEVDAVFITSPDTLHLRDAQMAFAQGKGGAMREAADWYAGRSGSHAGSGRRPQAPCSALRTTIALRTSVDYMRERIATGDIGTPRTAHAEFNYAAQFSPRQWITDPALAAGGPVGDVGVHCIDTLRWMLGAEARSVSTLAVQDELSGAVEASASLQLGHDERHPGDGQRFGRARPIARCWKWWAAMARCSRRMA